MINIDDTSGSLTLSSEERAEILNQIWQAQSVLTLIRSDCDDGHFVSGVETLSGAVCCANDVLSQVTDRLNA